MSDVPLVLTSIDASDVAGLTAMMTASFDDSTRRNTGRERGGPPGYDTEEFFREWAVGKPYAWKAVDGDQVVGAVFAFPGEDGHHYLGRIFVDPAAQRRGYGGRIWDQVYDRFPEALSWTLDTPEAEVSNHLFYEGRCGFVLVDQVEADDGPSRIYRRSGPAATGAAGEG
ncbi:GNAT family N-acetyltransferase [Sanguibacter suarezii]|uniref:GNAT family N-acetyltransferase n=1 Tax=Sanguibacter suarezii TaxID=60921 RepID=UPI00082FF8D9|nr:GNAT family N-acetyltransferase [Sanguibacter suarezii]